MNKFPVYIKATIFLLLILLIIIFLSIGKTFFIPLFIALLLTFLMYPVSAKLEKWGLWRAPAIILSILLAIIIFGGVIYFISNQIMSFTEDAPALKKNIFEKLNGMQAYISSEFHIDEQSQITWMKKRLQSVVESGGAIFSSVFTLTGTIIAGMGIIPIYIFFLTYYRDKFQKFIFKISKEEHHAHILSIVERTSKVSAKYIQGLLIDITILSVLNSAGFLLLGLKHAVLLGVIASILNVIPYIGVLIGSIFPVVIALLTKDSLWYAAGAAGVCVFVQFLDNNFITPKVVGSSVSINPLVTLMALIIGGLIWGVAGMMLFIPFLGMIKVIFDDIQSLQPYGYLLGEETRMKDSVKFTRLKELMSNLKTKK
ncbi:MAG: AI-2E family transporter [Bacteroidia bacterium]